MILYSESKIYHGCRRGGGGDGTCATSGKKSTLEQKRWKYFRSLCGPKSEQESENKL